MRITPITDYVASRGVDSTKSIMPYSRYLIMKAQTAGNLRLDAMAGFITLVEGSLLTPQRTSALRAALTRLTEKQLI